MQKTRYSAFFNSQLDSMLRARRIRNLVFVGIATNVCVESTLRDGFNLEYFGVMLEDATHQLGVDIFVLMMVIADEADAAAEAKWQLYRDGADHDALAWLTAQSAANNVSATTNTRQLSDPASAVNINMGTLFGSYDKVAWMLDEMAAVPGTGGVLLTFDDFLIGIENFGSRIQPLMKSRRHIFAEQAA